MAEIDLFEDYRIEQQLEPRPADWKMRIFGEAGYKSAKDIFYSKYDTKAMESRLRDTLKNAPMNENRNRYAKDSDEISAVKDYISEFYQDFYSINDEFTKNIERDGGFRLRSANMLDLFETTLTQVVDNGGYDPQELELTVLGNAAGAKAYKSQARDQIDIYKTQLQSSKDRLDAIGSDTRYGMDSEEYENASNLYSTILEKLEESTGLDFGVSEKDIEKGRKTSKGEVQGAFDLAEYEKEIVKINATNLSLYDEVGDPFGLKTDLGTGVGKINLVDGKMIADVDVGALKTQYENNYYNAPGYQNISSLTPDSNPVISLANDYGLKKSYVSKVLNEKRLELNKEKTPVFTLDPLIKRQQKTKEKAKTSKELHRTIRPYWLKHGKEFKGITYTQFSDMILGSWKALGERQKDFDGFDDFLKKQFIKKTKTTGYKTTP